MKQPQKTGRQKWKVLTVVVVVCLISLAIFVFRSDLSDIGLQNVNVKHWSMTRGRIPINRRDPTGQEQMDCWTNGQWRPDPTQYSVELEQRLDAFFRKARDLYKLPNPLQRSDGRCGNLTFSGELNFRAVCDQFGSTPCCHQGLCSSQSPEKCKCSDCLDFRQRLHGELSTYQSKCPVRYFTPSEACGLLRGKTIVFIGDSFMRQMYMATQILLTGNDFDSCMRNVTNKLRHHCTWMFMFTRECRYFVLDHDVLCGGHVKIHLYQYFQQWEINIPELIKEYKSDPRTVFVVGVGIHYSMNYVKVQRQVAVPILQRLSLTPATDLRKVVWLLPHGMGLLKSPARPSQLNPGVRKFNTAMRSFLADRGVVAIDAFNLTRNLKSYDGAHYAKAANILKVQVFLNYLAHRDTVDTD